MELLNWVRLGRKINIFYWSQTMQFLGMLQSYYMRYSHLCLSNAAYTRYSIFLLRDMVVFSTVSFEAEWGPLSFSRISSHSLITFPLFHYSPLFSFIFIFLSSPPYKSRNKYFLSTCLGIMTWAKVWTLLPDAQVWILTPQSLVVTLYRSLSLSMPQFSHFLNKNYMIYITELLLRLNKLRDLRCL